MTWKIKIKGDKYIVEVLSDDLSHAIFKVDEWRSQGAEVWIEDVNGNKVDEATVSKAPTKPTDLITAYATAPAAWRYGPRSGEPHLSFAADPAGLLLKIDIRALSTALVR